MLLAVLSSALTGAKIGGGAADLWYGKHGDNVQRGYEFLDDYEKSDYEDEKALSSALSAFQSVPDDEKDYLKVCRDYGLAIAYAYNAQFTASYRCLDNIDQIEIGFFTAKSDTIEEIKGNAVELREKVRDMEKSYLKWLEESKASQQTGIEGSESTTSDKWKFLFVAACIVLVLMLIAYFLFK